MGLPTDSFQHDNCLEFAAHWLINKFTANDGRLPSLLAHEAREWLRAVQDTHNYKRSHARTRSPHRFPATAWEALMVDWLADPEDSARAAALISVCVRIVTGSLGTDSRLLPLAVAAQAQAELIRDLFDQLAGDSGKPFYNLAEAMTWAME